MAKNSAKRRQLRLKFKRRAAALMGTAIMTGAVLSGIPVAKTFAAEAAAPPPVKTVQAQAAKDQRPPGRGWHEHKYSWPSPDENQAWYQDGKIYYRNGNYDSHRYPSDYAYYADSPVNYVKEVAANYGFDSDRDSFSLLTINSRRALVEVRKQDTGQLYNVLLERNGDYDWAVVSVSPV
ncbi:hypothetical protein [Sporomusa acidovorans]|uniref:Uncharacterized protein n=1 Tax=Sporomusa acidovorans (strain ATCC 49682 / DSM 3132 / Mol) TaxID=1123286 RepID=A0ABZ3J8V6_SPOA4|nr:hypothetical protein [Sporomusa acidovorans]OZC16217.1 hypothetical protein SPACI_45840 [Sporomusa acidovorans DSM 3132]SDE31667.1 hypothetical protein SAMN04488499_101185 [Sporomusa acidovorans]